jgi:hypothetical protein
MTEWPGSTRIDGLRKQHLYDLSWTMETNTTNSCVRSEQTCNNGASILIYQKKLPKLFDRSDKYEAVPENVFTTHRITNEGSMCVVSRDTAKQESKWFQIFIKFRWTVLLTHWGRGHLNCLNTRSRVFFNNFNPFNAELNPICYLLSLLAHHFLHVSRITVKSLTLRLLMSYIYIYIYMWSTYSWCF